MTSKEQAKNRRNQSFSRRSNVIMETTLSWKNHPLIIVEYATLIGRTSARGVCCLAHAEALFSIEVWKNLASVGRPAGRPPFGSQMLCFYNRRPGRPARPPSAPKCCVFTIGPARPGQPAGPINRPAPPSGSQTLCFYNRLGRPAGRPGPPLAPKCCVFAIGGPDMTQTCPRRDPDMTQT